VASRRAGPRVRPGYLSTLLGGAAELPPARTPYRPAWGPSVGTESEHEAPGSGPSTRRDGGHRTGVANGTGAGRARDAGRTGPEQDLPDPGPATGGRLGRHADPGRDLAAAAGPAGESLRPAHSGPDVVPRRPGQHAAGPARTEPASARREPSHVEAPGAEAPDASWPIGRDASGIPAPAERAAAPTRVSALPPERASAAPPEPGPAPPTVQIGVVEVRVAAPAPAPVPVTGTPAPVTVPPAASRLSRPAVPFGLAQG
jgi:hypothetical protein